VNEMRRPPTLWLIAAGVLLLAACDGASQCTLVTVYAADEARACLGPPKTITELRACSGQPTRGVRIICLVDSGGQLYVATVGDSAQVSGTGWRSSDGFGDAQLSATEELRCSDFSSRVGFPEPAKQCSP